MNHTNRGLNRVILFFIGAVLLAVGALVVTACVWPTAADAWATAGEAAQAWLVAAVDATPIGGTSITWAELGVIAAAVLVMALLIAALTSIGGRRSRAISRATGSHDATGRVTVTEAFASDALKNSLARTDDVLVTHVTADTIRREPVLHVSVTPRQNTDPRQLVEHVDRLVTNLATLTGQDTATYISVHTGLRARLAGDRRRVT